MEVCACTHESNLSKNGNMHSKEEKKKKDSSCGTQEVGFRG